MVDASFKSTFARGASVSTCIASTTVSSLSCSSSGSVDRSRAERGSPGKDRSLTGRGGDDASSSRESGRIPSSSRASSSPSLAFAFGDGLDALPGFRRLGLSSRSLPSGISFSPSSRSFGGDENHEACARRSPSSDADQVDGVVARPLPFLRPEGGGDWTAAGGGDGGGEERRKGCSRSGRSPLYVNCG